MGRIMERGVLEATVVELVLGLATAFALANFVQGLAFRTLADQQQFVVPWVQILAPLVAFLVLAGLLGLMMHLRIRADDAMWLEEEEEESEATEA